MSDQTDIQACESPTERELMARWLELARQVPLKGEVGAAGGRILDCYKQAHRKYHNMDHLLYCLKMLDEVAGEVKDPQAAAAALWFHDAVYEPGKADNEARSAALAREVLGELGMAPGRIEKVAHLVLATDHSGAFLSPDACIVCDIDLSILGQPAQVYERYAAAIRQEYDLPDEAFRAGRRRFLARMLGPSLTPPFERGLFHTKLFMDRFGVQAGQNMRAEMAKLADPTAGI